MWEQWPHNRGLYGYLETQVNELVEMPVISMVRFQSEKYMSSNEVASQKSAPLHLRGWECSLQK